MLDGRVLLNGGRGLRSMDARQAVNVLEVWAVETGIDLRTDAAPDVEPIPEGKTQADLIREQMGIISDQAMEEVNQDG